VNEVFFKPGEKTVEYNGVKFQCRGLTRYEYEEIREKCALYDVNMETGQIKFKGFSVVKMKALMIMAGALRENRKMTFEQVKQLNGELFELLYETIRELTDLPEAEKKKYGVISTASEDLIK